MPLPVFSFKTLASEDEHVFLGAVFLASLGDVGRAYSPTVLSDDEKAVGEYAHPTKKTATPERTAGLTFLQFAILFVRKRVSQA